MEFDHRFTLRGIFRPVLAFEGPPTVDLQIHWTLLRRVFSRTFEGNLPPTVDDAIDAFISSHYGFSLRPFSEFRQQVLMSIRTDLDFSSSLSDSLSHHISSSVNDLLDETLIGLYPHLIVVTEIIVVHNVYFNYDPIHRELIPHRGIIQQRQLASSVNENRILDTTPEAAFIIRRLERGSDDEDDFNDVYENFIRIALSEDNEDNNTGIGMGGGGGGGVDCSICLEELSEGQEVTTMACQHSYHVQCLLSWLERSQTCPLCRQPV